jgi:hypothetical protein
MKTMAEHFNRVNNSTLHSNYNTGQILDPSRYSMQQKIQKQFESGKKIEYGYNNQNNFKDDVSNFASNQLQQVGYKYGNS